jgi:type IV pilus biogenesis protein CpaD/CtpE
MTKRMVYGIIVAALALAVVGCAYQPAPTPAMEPYDVAVERELVVAESEFMGDEEAYAPVEPGLGAANYSAIERLIVRNASLSLVVSDTEQALEEIKDLVAELGGYVVESNDRGAA